MLPPRFRSFWFFVHACGIEYSQCINALKVIKNELKDFGIVDFIDLDIFFWHIYDDIMPAKPREVRKEVKVVSVIKPTKVQISDHDGVNFTYSN